MKYFAFMALTCLLCLNMVPNKQIASFLTDSPVQIVPNSPSHNKIVVGYYAQWAIYARNYGVHQIEADKLTHLMYAFYDTKFDPTTEVTKLVTLDSFADLQHNKYQSQVTYPDGTGDLEKGNFGQLKMLKEEYPHLTIMMSIGGWTRSQAFPALAASENGRKTLADEMVAFMQKYPWFGGFDIDWEFPDFLGYLQQRGEGPERETAVGLNDEIALGSRYPSEFSNESQ